MKVAALTADHTFAVVDVDDPTPGPGDLVVAVHACGICGSDLKSHTMLPDGTVLGHEFCGEVVAVGADARDRWTEGQVVAALPVTACGRCRWCMAGLPAHCETADLVGVGGTPGGFSEYVRIDAGSAYAIDPEVGTLGALVEPLAVGLHTVRTGEVGPGDRVLVMGGGSVGSSVALWSRRLGASEVVVSDPSPSRRDGADRFGATGVHDPTAGPPPAGFDVVIECVGIPGMIQGAVDAATVGGRVVIAGVCMEPDPFVPVGAVLKELTMRFAVYYRRDEFAAAATLLNRATIDARSFVSDEVGLDGVTDAFARLLGSTTERKILVVPGS